MKEEKNDLEQDDVLDGNKKKNLIKYLFIVIIALLLVGNVSAFYYIFKNKENKSENINQEEGYVNDQYNSISSTTIEATPMQEIDIAKGEVLVTWNDWPVQVDSWQLFDINIQDKITKFFNNNKNPDYENIGTTAYIQGFRVYKIGVISKGNYTGKDLYLVTFQPNGPIRMQMLRIVKDDKGLIVLGKHSDELFGALETQIFILNNQIRIANLETAETISIPNSEIVLKKRNEEPYRLLASYDNPEKIFVYDGESYVYKDRIGNCFIVKAKDGTVREYSFETKFLGEKSSTKTTEAVPYKLDITWSDGEKNSNEYVFEDLSSCGGLGCQAYADYIGDGDVKEMGKTSTGDSIYALKNTSFKNKLKEIYDQYYPGYNSETQKQNEKISYDKFLLDKPLIFWKDPFGKFIEFRDAKYLPGVECGKPVIYLYPTKTTDVSVKVAPTGGFTITEPAYNDGWFVRATKNSELYNYNDKTVYPYLFWEGHGINYDRPNEGFVVAKSDVKQLLINKLSQFGLIEKEYNEFIEFWLPKMQEKNYYFITFVPQNEFDKLAPLSISPKPDTIIRVFMDFEGLDAYRNVIPQTIMHTDRRGFTVVEWGGALHK